MPSSCVKISDTVVLGIPRSALVLSLPVADLCSLQPVHIQHSQVICLLQAFQNVDHFQQILDHLGSFYFAALMASSQKLFWIFGIVSTKECSSLMQYLMQICCSIHSFWMWQPHRTQAHSTVSTTPLTRTVKSSLFRYAHSSPLSLADGLQWCPTKHSHYINNSWTFSRHTP